MVYIFRASTGARAAPRKTRQIAKLQAELATTVTHITTLHSAIVSQPVTNGGQGTRGIALGSHGNASLKPCRCWPTSWRKSPWA